MRTFKGALSDVDAVEIAEEYFRGIKEIVFVSSGDALRKIVKELEARFIERKIRPEKQDLIIDQWNPEETAIKNSYSVFNCEIEVVSDLSTYVDEDLLIEEGALSEKDEGILRALSEQTDFNYQQYEIEHAPTDRNILITAGAGTGKTYSMVSRIAYLCNKSADAVVDITGEIAMITFTKD
ncbi:MAG: UvrD-helicase domain-containing protein, partial [Oscillospiraceae bacterium]|nr:UvrD-helicase domain-containing protein [Oscillospiraceae bacterium]